jgi:phosphatidate cytidylyltransferase
MFGRHKLREAISPNKTWGGALGALAVSMALPWLLRFSFPHFGPLQLVLTGLIVGVGGQLGDLTISMIKRDIGMKDMGSLIPGHGGVLDRIDSLIFAGPLFFHMVRWFYDVY